MTKAKKKKSKGRVRGVRGRGSVFERKTKTQGTKWVTSISYVDWAGVRHRPQLTFGSREQALAATKFLETEKNTKGKISSSVVTITQLSGLWLDQMQVESGTRLNRESSLRLHILPYLGRKRLLELTPDMIAQWKNLLRTSGVAPTSMKQAWSVLSCMLRHAVKLRLMSVHLMSGLEAPRVTPKEIVPFTAEEMAKIFQKARGSFYLPLLELIYALGLRQGEAFGLKWTDIDEEEGTLKIHRQLVTEQGKVIEKDRPKTSSGVRTLALSAEHREILERQRAQCQGKKFEGCEWIFPTNNGYHMNRNNFWTYVWKPLLADAGVKHRGLHHFRHTAATELITSGASLPDVSGALGHKHPADTMRMYVHNSRKVQGQVFGALARNTKAFSSGQAADGRLDKESESWDRCPPQGEIEVGIA